MYKLIRPFLFLLTPEKAHVFTLKALQWIRHIPLSGAIMRLFYSYKRPSLEREVFGIKFPNPIGLAAGLDKNATSYNDLANLGFGFIEIGSVTPVAQDGNPKPRCFRLVGDKAIINRMGINNVGVKQVVQNIRDHKPRVIIGGNISKNSTTSNEEAHKDYEKAFAHMYDFVDYFVLNVSCPNVRDLQQLQSSDNIAEIVKDLTQIRRYNDIYRPILLKLSPDLPLKVLDGILEIVQLSGLDGVVACNTTTSREGLTTAPKQVSAIGNGGLSGAPLKQKALEMVRYIAQKTNGNLPIIGCGGVMTPADAQDLLEAGASLVQVYTGFIYQGPGFVRSILKTIK